MNRSLCSKWALLLFPSRSCRLKADGDVRLRSKLPAGRGGFDFDRLWLVVGVVSWVTVDEWLMAAGFELDVRDLDSDALSERTHVKSSSQHVESSVSIVLSSKYDQTKDKP